MARRHVSLHLITLSKECLEEAMKVIAEQNNYDALDNTTNDTAFVEQDIATEIEFNTTIDVSSICEREVSFLMSANGDPTATSRLHWRVRLADGTHAQRSGRSAFAMERQCVFTQKERSGRGGAVC